MAQRFNSVLLRDGLIEDDGQSRVHYQTNFL